MTKRERAQAVRHAEKCVAQLLGKGWVLDTLQVTDDASEGLTIAINVHHRGFDVEEKGVM